MDETEVLAVPRTCHYSTGYFFISTLSIATILHRSQVLLRHPVTSVVLRTAIKETLVPEGQQRVGCVHQL